MRRLLGWILLTHAMCAVAADPPRDRLLGLLEQHRESTDLPRLGQAAARFVSYRDAVPASVTFGVELCVLEAGQARLRVKDLRTNQAPAELFPAVFGSQALGVMSGGFFDIDPSGRLIPLGLVKADGKTVSARFNWTSGGIVAASAHGVSILPIASAGAASDHSDVLQSKPLLVEDGRDGIRSAGDDRFDRSAIALDARGHIYFFVLHEPSGAAGSLAEFSRLLLGYRSSDGQPILNALAMDGGPGAHLYVPALGRHCGAGTANFVPNAFYVER
jgi:hypothetical protein